MGNLSLELAGPRVGAVCRGGEVRLWSRNGKDFTAKFPDVQAALAAQVDVADAAEAREWQPEDVATLPDPAVDA